MCYAFFEGRCADPNCARSHATPTRKQLAIYTEAKAKREEAKKAKPAPKEPAVPAAGSDAPAAKEAPKPKKKKKEAPAAIAAPVGSAAFVDLDSDHDSEQVRE